MFLIKIFCSLLLLHNLSFANEEDVGKKKDGYVLSSKHHEINENPDKCAMLNQVQSVVIQLLGSHYEYIKGIEVLTTATNTIQTDIAIMKMNIHKLENNTSKLEEDIKCLSNTSTNSSYKLPQLKNVLGKNTTKILKQLTSKSKQNSIVKSALAANMPPIMEKDFTEYVKNFTKIISTKDKMMTSLKRTVNKMRKAFSYTQGKFSSLSQMYKNSSAETMSMKYFLNNQKDVNGQLLNRIQYLEEHMKQMVQSDSPNVQPNGCPSEFIRHFSSCYLFLNDSKNWIDAEKFCQSLHPWSHLVGIETAEEEEFIVKYRNYNTVHWSSMYIWTGANDIGKENGWSWVSSGKPLSYTNWRPGQPDSHNSKWQHCIYFRTDGHDHRWDDWHCHAAKLNYVCEMPLQAK